MHRLGPFWRLLMASLLFSAGCTPRSDLAEVRSIFVREPQGAFSDEMRFCGEAAHDAAVRRLRSLGYRAATDEADADAILEGRWEVSAPAAEASRQRVTLRLRLCSRGGEDIITTPVIEAAPVAFLSKERVGELVGERLAAFGPAPLRR